MVVDSFFSYLLSNSECNLSPYGKKQTFSVLQAWERNEFFNWGLGKGAFLKWLDSGFENFPSGLNMCGKGYQRDQFMLHLHFLFVRLKTKRALKKKTKNKKKLML